MEILQLLKDELLKRHAALVLDIFVQNRGQLPESLNPFSAPRPSATPLPILIAPDAQGPPEPLTITAEAPSPLASPSQSQDSPISPASSLSRELASFKAAAAAAA